MAASQTRTLGEKTPLQTEPRTLAPAMPPMVDAFLHENWGLMDSEAERMMGWMQSQRVFHEFSHASAPFMMHLRNTYAILKCWGQPDDLCRCGLLHSAYSKDGFNFRLFDIMSSESRAELRSIVGEKAERLIFNYCATDIDNNWDINDAIDDNCELSDPLLVRSLVEHGKNKVLHKMITLGEPLDPNGYDIPCRWNGQETLHLSAKDVAHFLMILAADIAEQHVAVNSYGDIAQVHEPKRLWPGDGTPAAGFFMFSRMLRSAAPYLDVVPPVFENCTRVLDLEDEKAALSAYMQAVRGTHQLPFEEQERLFRRAAELNPFFAEPHTMLSQLLFNRGAFAEAAAEAARGLELLYQWATALDKRYSWNQWVGFTRLCHLRAKRRELGRTALPTRTLSDSAIVPAREVSFLQDVSAGFAEFTEGAEKTRARL